MALLEEGSMPQKPDFKFEVSVSLPVSSLYFMLVEQHVSSADEVSNKNIRNRT